MADLAKAKEIKKYARTLGIHVSLSDAKRLSTASREELLEFYMQQVEDVLPRLRRDYDDLVQKYQELKEV